MKQSIKLDLVGAASDGQAAITMTDELQPDIVLIDIGLPVLNGIEATRAIKAKHPDIKVLVLTSHSEPRVVEEIMGVGADGYCLKGISTDRLLALVEEVHQGIFWVDAKVAEQIKKYFQPTQSTPKASSPEDPENQAVSITSERLECLTERENEVLSLITRGKKNQDIAEILCISPGTVRVHVHAILHKLKVKDRTQAALLAVQKQVKN